MCMYICKQWLRRALAAPWCTHCGGSVHDCARLEGASMGGHFLKRRCGAHMVRAAVDACLRDRLTVSQLLDTATSLADARLTDQVTDIQ